MTMQLVLLITPTYLDVLLLILGIVGGVLLLWFFYRFILLPVMQVMADTSSPPPSVGEKRELILKNGRLLKYRIGLADADWKLRMKGISDDHLIIDFKKDRNLEEYEISLSAGAAMFYRAPHEKHLQLLKSKISLESRELIGHPALLRLVAAMQNDRPVHYIEFELSTRYFIDNSGDERMKFIISLERIVPGIDKKARSKRGVYNFGRDANSQPAAADE